MFGFWEQFILNTTLGLLTSLKKSPQNIPMFKTILTHIVTDGCELLGVQPPTIP